MATEGAEAFQALKSSIRAARADLDGCRAEAAELDARMRDLLALRGEALLKLARHYLPTITRPVIEQTFEGIRSDLLAILAEREARRSELQAKLDEANEANRARNAEIDDVTRRLNEKVALREQLEAKVAEILKGNADFQERSKLALQAEEKLHRDEGRVEELSRESAEKLPHYDKSRLFRYLHDRAYGTAEYAPTGWVREVDRWLAALIDYPNARNGYEFLKKTPALVAEEVSRRRDLFAQLMQQVEAIEKAEADEIGLTAVLEEGDALGTGRDRLVQEATRLQKQAQGLQQDLADLEQAQNAFHRRAIDRFRKFLGETKVAYLRKRAQQTPEPEDDAIVDELDGLDRQIQDISPRLAALGARREAADRIQEGLDRVLRKYRQANYDSDRSYLEGIDLDRSIARFLEGEAEADDLWRAIKSAQKFRPNWVETTATHGVQVATSPSGRVILGAIVDIAGAAMQAAAYRGVRRRADASFPTFPTFPSSGGGGAPPSSGGWSSGSGSEGGFTTTDGF